MIVAGFGFRRAATIGSFADVLAQIGGDDPPDAFATVDEKTVQLSAFARSRRMRLIGVSRTQLAGIETASQSTASQRAYQTGSVAEAAALAAAGPGARLLVPRRISSDRMATCALAIGGQT